MPYFEPYLRWMQFVDGENLTMAAQRFATDRHLQLEEDHYERDSFFWLPQPGTSALIGYSSKRLENSAIRSHYYTSTVGGDDVQRDLRRRLRKFSFEPHVFKRDKGTRRSKGVDIALARDMLSDAFRGNYEAAVLVTGDADYVPLTDEVKRLGKIVIVEFFIGGSGQALQEAADRFNDISEKAVAQFPKLAPKT